MIKWINHTCFIVKDLEKSLVFYRDLLGMTVEREEFRDQGSAGSFGAALFGQEQVRYNMVYLGIGDMRHSVELVQFFDPVPEQLDQGRPVDIGSGHLGIIVEDLDDVYARLSAEGVEFLTPPQVRNDTPAYPWARKGAFAKDPDGNWLEFLERPEPTEQTGVV